ncbi:MAG: hypothetical protein DWQ35_02415 [Planctomycetota bacterium]|nr:MAG: hypothetical protein DWQ35_02415 [Planctomycetota bacterium]REK27657.1 MAG: hypothetical protein DWQ42_06755 [Planctomycetota bacterium]REK38500.1 MAG: hypothetical protein DWQ46_20430 [Planctomycetota bacterium]
MSEKFFVPRRFDLATLIALVVGYAILFGVIRAVTDSPWIFAGVVGLFTCVGIAQSWFYGGNRPRVASMHVGVFYAIGVAVVATYRDNPAGFSTLRASGRSTPARFRPCCGAFRRESSPAF